MSMDRQVQGRQNRLLGKWGEALIAEYLRDRGWCIEGAEYRCRVGEIDLIAANEEFLAFVEVKLRKNDDYGTAGEAVTYRKRERLRAAAQIYLATHQKEFGELQPRFDVAEVYAPQGYHTARPKIIYIENAF